MNELTKEERMEKCREEHPPDFRPRTNTKIKKTLASVKLPYWKERKQVDEILSRIYFLTDEIEEKKREIKHLIGKLEIIRKYE